MKKIFVSRKTVIVAPGTHHFEKPSKQHCERFIRTANALVDGAEVFFIATCCLPYIPDNVRHFYSDTGGISVLAFAINSVRRRFDNDAFAATVNTFESYEGLERFEFRDVDSSVLLLSASTSGSLEKRILEKHPRFQPSQIITVFGTGFRAGSHIVFDATQDADCSEILGDGQSFPSTDCPLCLRGSIAIPMMGDQFIPVRSNSERVTLTKTSGPKWLERSLELFATTKTIHSFYRGETTLQASKEIYFDFQHLLNETSSDSKAFKRISRQLDQSLPAFTQRIIHLDDIDSQQLALEMAKRLSHIKSNGTKPEVIPAKQVDSLLPLNSGATVVVASAVASGNSLLAMSRALRDLQTNHAVSYFVVLSRLQHSTAFEKLESDLRMGETATDFSLSVVERINLPTAGPNVLSSWDEEQMLLQGISDTIDGTGRNVVEQRLEILFDAQSERHKGLINNLFWNRIDGNPMSLTHGFVYLNRHYDE